MSSNSIINNLTPSNAISEINLLLYEPKHLIKTFVVVEGDDDCRILAPLLETDTVIVESYGSKSDVIKIVKQVRKNRVIGIVDKDYDYRNHGKRIFSYDYSCAEMMIVQDDICMEKTLINLRNRDYLKYDEMRFNTLKGVEHQGHIRKLSYQNNWNIKFDGIKPSNYYHIDVLQRKIRLVNEINTKSPIEKITRSREPLVNGYVEQNSLEYLLNITNGHDFFQLFAYLYGRGTAIKHVVSLSIASFGIESFRKTQLYILLKSYQIEKKLNICN